MSTWRHEEPRVPDRPARRRRERRGAAESRSPSRVHRDRIRPGETGTLEPPPGRATALALALLALASTARLVAATFPVADPAAFQAALTTAASNGEDDVVEVASGVLILGATLVYSAGEERQLTIRGAGAGATILDGADAVQLLSLTSSGGGILVEDLTLRHGSSSGASGGALNLETASGPLTLRDCEITDSAVTGEHIGGGAALFSDTGQVTVSSCAFRRNASNANVGGLYAATTSGSILVEGSTFEQNSVDNTGGSEYYGDGGGAMLYHDAGGDATVRSSTFTGNTTSGGDNPDGGGLMLYLLGAGVTATVESSTFTENQAGLGGGGLFVRVNGSGSITCRDNSLSANRALGGDGGGAFLYLDQGTLVVEGNEASLNAAGADGGGFWISHGSGTATVDGNAFSENDASGLGGGLHLVTDSASVAMKAGSFWKNTAGGVGGGFSYATGTGALELSRSSFHANASSASGAGLNVYVDQASAPPTLVELILWGNAPDQLGYATGRAPGTRGGLDVRWSDVQDGTGEGWFGEGSIDADPLFVDAASGDLRLDWPGYPDPSPPRSPAIDAGDPTSPADPDGSRADMGAFPFDQAGFVFADGFESGDTSSWA